MLSIKSNVQTILCSWWFKLTGQTEFSSFFLRNESDLKSTWRVFFWDIVSCSMVDQLKRSLKQMKFILIVKPKIEAWMKTTKELRRGFSIFLYFVKLDERNRLQWAAKRDNENLLLISARQNFIPKIILQLWKFLSKNLKKIHTTHVNKYFKSMSRHRKFSTCLAFQRLKCVDGASIS